MLGDSPGPAARLMELFQEVACDPGCGKPRRPRLLARAPLAALPHDAADRRNSRGSAAAGACAAAADTPCISMLSQKAEGLSLRSAQPPARDNLARGARAQQASHCYSSPSPQLPVNNPKRKLYESPAGDLTVAPSASSGGRPRRLSRSAPLKRHCGGGLNGGLASMPALPTYSNPPSPLATLRSCISAPEPMITSSSLAEAEDPAAPATAPAAALSSAAAVADGLQAARALTAVAAAAMPTPPPSPALGRALFASPRDMAADTQPLDGMITACAEMQLPEREGSQDDTMCSPLPAALPSTCAPAAKRRVSLHTAPPSLVPMVENPGIGLPSIEPETVAQLLTGHHAWDDVQRAFLVDCRYNYEHVGGCIIGAVNMQDPTAVEEATIGAAGAVDWARTPIIFYCEFSSERGPRMFRHIRNLDRRLHLASYPALAVPHMYVLAGGYKAFQERYPQLCTPKGAYVRMGDKRFDARLKQQHSLSKAAWCRKDTRKKTALPRHGD